MSRSHLRGNCAINNVLKLKRLFLFLNQRRRRRAIAADSNASRCWTRLRRGLSPGYQQSTTVVVQQESIHVHHPTILLLANIMTVDIVIGRHDNDDGQTQTELLGLPWRPDLVHQDQQRRLCLILLQCRLFSRVQLIGETEWIEQIHIAPLLALLRLLLLHPKIPRTQ